MRRSIAYYMLVLVAGAACGGDDNGPSNPGAVESSVFEIQSKLIATGTRVRVEARVMAVSSGGDRVWISDALVAAGITGVEVYRGPSPGAPAVAVGDEIEVVGRVQEFGSGAGLTVTQIAEAEVTVLNTATGVPVPLTGLDPAVITLDPVPGASQNGEPYEGVLVSITNLRVSLASPFTLATLDGETEFAAENQIIALNDPVETCYISVTGIWNYNTVTDRWVITPIQGGMVVTGCDPA